ncbi:MAG: hypothetical protein HOF76_00030 [Candidatus Scalindua sp.]|nr:hypothetical protein [Candidatus Scalindua sp.]
MNLKNISNNVDYKVCHATIVRRHNSVPWRTIDGLLISMIGKNKPY